MSQTAGLAGLVSPQTVTLILDRVTAENLLIALTNALQGGGGKKKKKKGDKGDKADKEIKLVIPKGLKLK